MMRFAKGLVSLLALVLALGVGLIGLSLFISNRAVAQSQPISVFFDFGRSDLNSSAKQIVAVVKDVLKPGVQITIAGHCDTAEAAPDKLSQARALAVAKAFVDIGLPIGAQLTIVGKGATELRKQTATKVREPVNRYAAITIN